MAAKILSPHPHPLTSLSLPASKFNNNRGFTHQKPWPGQARNPTKAKRVAVCVSLQDVLSSAALGEHHNSSSLILLAESTGYSLASYYTSLGLFVISVPGLWSLIKRSVKSKVHSHHFPQFFSCFFL
jgi:hypothetical protein